MNEKEARENDKVIDCKHYSEKNHPVYWNPYNKAVQCHQCGEQFIPIEKAKGLVEALKSASDILSKHKFYKAQGRLLTQIDDAIAKWEKEK